MSIPDFQSLMLPLLNFASDGEVRTLSDAREHLASAFALTNDEIEELLPSGRQRRFDNRVAWAKVYLEQAGLLVSPKRGRFQITPEGKVFLETSPTKITIASLDQFEKFRAFRASAKTSKKEQEVIC